MANQQHSCLGHILLTKGLINQAQLDSAIRMQTESGRRLGEILVQQGLLTNRQLSSSLSKQSRLRLAAGLIAVLLTPLQPILASPRLTSPTPAPAAQGLQPLSEEQMRAAAAQGLEDGLPLLLMQAESNKGTSTPKQLSSWLPPILDILEAQTSLHDIRYDTDQLSTSLNADGSLNVRLPSSIGEVRFDNIRVAGAPSSRSFGCISLQNIDLSGSSLKIQLRH
ncbi:hypothetical protein [Pseudomonas sp. B392_1p]|uniref:hypothetical protein n=1 Tax=Pseudomonas sp. B392_1p TaxID=3457507 RepID=UPI003FD55838